MKIRSMLVAALCALVLVSFAGVAPASQGQASQQVPEGAQPLGDGRYAVELKAPTPDWYTPQLHADALKARESGRGAPLPAEARSEFESALLFTGIRPGSWMISPAWCTLNFVFGNPDAGTATSGGGGSDDGKSNNGKGSGKNNDKGNGSGKEKKTGGSGGSGGGTGVYVGTAGHCSETGEEVVIVAAPGVLMNIGRTVKSVDGGVGNDFALIEIYPEMVQYVNPSMTYFGGPDGIKSPEIGDAIVHAGHGAAVGTGGTPRAGVVTYVGNGDNNARTAYGWDGAASPGDSGSATRHADGRAEGNLTHLVVGGEYVPAIIAGTSAPYMEQLAGQPICYAPIVPNPLPAPTCAR